MEAGLGEIRVLLGIPRHVEVVDLEAPVPIGSRERDVLREVLVLLVRLDLDVLDGTARLVADDSRDGESDDEFEFDRLRVPGLDGHLRGVAGARGVGARERPIPLRHRVHANRQALGGHRHLEQKRPCASVRASSSGVATTRSSCMVRSFTPTRIRAPTIVAFVFASRTTPVRCAGSSGEAGTAAEFGSVASSPPCGEAAGRFAPAAPASTGARSAIDGGGEDSAEGSDATPSAGTATRPDVLHQTIRPTLTTAVQRRTRVLKVMGSISPKNAGENSTSRTARSGPRALRSPPAPPATRRVGVVNGHALGSFGASRVRARHGTGGYDSVIQ